MKIALMGSVSSSWHALDALIKNSVDVCCVMGVDESQSEKIGDYRSLREIATKASIPFLSFIKVREPEVRTFLEQHKPDMLWVIGISQLVPDDLINIAPKGGIGFHPTMLPEGRGRAPVAWTIIKNARAAACLFTLTDEADAGDLLAQREVPVLPDDYSEDLIERTNHALQGVIADLAPALISGDITFTPQDHSKATHYERRTPADGIIDWSADTETIYRLIRAAGRPYPGAFTHAEREKLTIWRARPALADDISEKGEPGTVLTINEDDEILIATGDAAIWATNVEGPGRDSIKTGHKLVSIPETA